MSSTKEHPILTGDRGDVRQGTKPSVAVTSLVNRDSQDSLSNDSHTPNIPRVDGGSLAGNRSKFLSLLSESKIGKRTKKVDDQLSTIFDKTKHIRLLKFEVNEDNRAQISNSWPAPTQLDFKLMQNGISELEDMSLSEDMVHKAVVNIFRALTRVLSRDVCLGVAFVTYFGRIVRGYVNKKAWGSLRQVFWTLAEDLTEDNQLKSKQENEILLTNYRYNEKLRVALGFDAKKKLAVPKGWEIKHVSYSAVVVPENMQYAFSEIYVKVHEASGSAAEPSGKEVSRSVAELPGDYCVVERHINKKSKHVSSIDLADQSDS